MPERRYPPNRALTWQRLERGWSHDELAVQLIASAARRGETDTGLTGNTVRRWEIGDRWPEPRFRKHLVLVLELPASQLGLLTPDELAFCPSDDIGDSAGRFLTMVGTETGAQRFNRQVFLRGLLGVSALPLLTPLGVSADTMEIVAHAVRQPAVNDNRAVEAYTSITEHQRLLYWTSPPAALFESVAAHTQLGLHLLQNGNDSAQAGLAAPVAHSALLAARLAFFDLRQVAVAERCFDVALEITRRAHDHALAAVVLAHLAFVPGFAGDANRARSLLDAAQAHGRYDAGPALRSWLHCVAAETTARTGDPRRSLVHCRQAEDSLATTGTDPVWLDFFDAARLAAYTGYSQLVAGRHGEAQVTLRRALNELKPEATKQRAVVLGDLAAAHARDDPEQAVSLAGQVLDQLEPSWYYTAYERITSVAGGLRSTRFADELTERLRALPGGT